MANHRTPGPGRCAQYRRRPRPPGEFIATCDDDDVWHPGKLEAQIGRLLDQPDLLVVGSGIRLMLPDGRIITWPARAERISQRLLLRNRVKELHSSTLAMRRDVFAKAGLYDEEIPNGYAEDYDWILRAARVGRIGAVLTPLADITEGQRLLVAGQRRRDRRGPGVPAGQAPGDRGVPARARPPARADRVLPVPARPARAGAAVRGHRHRQVASVAARVPGAGAYRDRRGPQASCCARPGWSAGGWPRSAGQRRREERGGSFMTSVRKAAPEPVRQGRPTCVPAGGHGDGAAAAAAWLHHDRCPAMRHHVAVPGADGPPAGRAARFPQGHQLLRPELLPRA